MKIEPFALERWMTTWETQVEFDITESGMLPLTTNDLLNFLPPTEREAYLAQLLDTRLGYSEAPGSQALRMALASSYERTGPENILVTNGAIEANYLLFNTLLEPGDEVVAVHPAYQQLFSVPRAIGCEVHPWWVQSTPTGFRYDLPQLHRLVNQRTRLIVINTPHNPTGAILSAAELEELYALAEANDALILCDEAYRWLQLPGQEPLPPPLRNLGDRAISVSTFSKPFGLPGLRIGWLAAPAAIVSACWGMRDYLSLSPGKLNDALALLAFQHRDQIIARNQQIIAANLATAERWFADHADLVRWTPPRAGLLALLHYRLAIHSQELADRLASEYSVMLAPGAAFDYEYALRIGVGQDPAIFAAALERTAACFADLQAAGVALRVE